MTHQTANPAKRNEAGNVLFLILIAVVLFAALSYAVTQSSRTGGGNNGGEKNLVNSSVITQYPASVRTAIIRMLVSNSVDVTTLVFNPPSAFSACTGPALETCVFLPAGGGATYVEAPAEVITTDTNTPWVFNGDNQVNLIGTTGGGGPTSATADIVAFLGNVKTPICEKINKQLGIAGGTIPTETGIDVTSQMTTTDPGIDAGGGTIGGTPSSLDGQAFGCFVQSGVNYYYHVLIEQ